MCSRAHATPSLHLYLTAYAVDPVGDGDGDGADADAHGGDPPGHATKRHRVGSSPAEPPAQPPGSGPAELPPAPGEAYALPQAAVHVHNMRDDLDPADAQRIQDMMEAAASRLEGWTRGQVDEVLRVFKAGSAAIGGDRWELWLVLVRRLIHAGSHACAHCATRLPQDEMLQIAQGQSRSREVKEEPEAQRALLAVFGADGPGLLYKLVVAARKAHMRTLTPDRRHRWQSMALIITLADAPHEDGVSRRQVCWPTRRPSCLPSRANYSCLPGRPSLHQVWHIDVTHFHSISVTSLTANRKPVQYVLPATQAFGGVPTLHEALMRLGIPQECLAEADNYINSCTTLNHIPTMLPQALPMLLRRSPGEEPMAVSENVDAAWGHQVVIEHLVVHRGMESPANKVRIVLFIETKLSGLALGSYDGAVQHIRYQFLLSLWLLEPALYWLFKDRLDMPNPGDFFAPNTSLARFLTSFVKAALQGDQGLSVAEKRDREPDAAFLQQWALKLAQDYYKYTVCGTDPAIPQRELVSVKCPPSWAHCYFPKGVPHRK